MTLRVQQHGGGGGWDRVINPVHDLGRSLLNFLVGGGAANNPAHSKKNSERCN